MLPFLLWTLACGGSPPEEDGPLPELPPRAEARARPVGEIRPPRALRLAFTGEVRGELEPCGCPTLPYGGFARRQRYLAALEAQGGGPLFVLDAGEALVKGLATADLVEARPRAQLVLELMRELGTRAWAPGPSDLRVLGLDGLRSGGVPAVSATWLADGAPAFPPAVVLEAEGLRLGVIGLSAPPPEGFGLTWRDPVEAARAASQDLGDGLDLVVALSNLPGPEAARVAEQVTGLAAVLSTRGDAHDAPRTLPGATLVETPDRGRHVTTLHLRLGSAADVNLDPSLDGALRQARALRSQLLAIEALGGTPEEGMRARAEELEAQLAGAGAGRNLVEVEDRPLGVELDGEAHPRVQAFKESQEARAREVVARAPAEGPRYATSGACAGCHSEQLARWTFTAHARAASTLTREGHAQDVECVGCHTTGYGEPGGFAELDRPSLMSYGGVQCEACHGPLSGHPRADGPRPREVTEQTCLGCHDEANSPNFDFARYLPAVICPSMPAQTLALP